MTVFLQPPSTDPPQRLFQETADRFVSLDRVAPYISAPTFDRLASEFPDHKIRLWGAIPGRSNTPLFQQVEPGDLVLFYRNRRIVYGLTVAATVHRGRDLAVQLWGEDGAGHAWEHLYVPRARHWLDIPYEELWEFIRFGPRDVLHGLLKLDPVTSEKVLNSYRTLSVPHDWSDEMTQLDQKLGLAPRPPRTVDEPMDPTSQAAPQRTGPRNGSGVPTPPSFSTPRPRRREEEPIPLGFDGPAEESPSGYGPTAEPIPPVDPPRPSRGAEAAIQAHAIHTAERFFDLEGYVVSRLSERSAGHLYCERGDRAHVVFVHGTADADAPIPVPERLVTASGDPGRSIALFVLHGLTVRPGRGDFDVTGGTIHVERNWRPSGSRLIPTLYEYRPEY